MLSIICFTLQAQSTWTDVYTLMQTNCTQSSCHNNADLAGGLDLQGTGGNQNQQQANAYNNIYFATPNNSFAQSKHYRIAYPGNPYESSLFRKINNELAIDVILDPNEGLACPQDGSTLDDEEIELVRQWILAGCDESGNVVSQNMISDYYNNGGIASVTSPPAPPDPAEGFQIHLGPFFIQPNTEKEIFSLMDTHLPDLTEINRIEVLYGGYSHHAIVYKLEDTSNINPSNYGMRGVDFENDIRLVVATQEPVDFHFPNGTAIELDGDAKLDMNSHYINYSPDKVLACDVYVNFYTQAAGTALHIMESELLPEYDIAIPPTGDTVTFTQSSTEFVNFPIPIYLWAISSHTHKLATDFDIYHRLSNGQKGAQIFDASCDGGIPGCSSGYYDYQHPPMMYKMPFEKIQLNEGIIYEASYANDGPNWVYWGETSEDEMMLTVIMYTFDTTGLGALNPTGFQPIPISSSGKFYPNPMNDYLIVDLSNINYFQSGTMTLFDLVGRKVKEIAVNNHEQTILYRDNLLSGIYFYRISDDDTIYGSGKIIVR